MWVYRLCTLTKRRACREKGRCAVKVDGVIGQAPFGSNLEIHNPLRSSRYQVFPLSVVHLQKLVLRYADWPEAWQRLEPAAALPSPRPGGHGGRKGTERHRKEKRVVRP